MIPIFIDWRLGGVGGEIVVIAVMTELFNVIS